MEYKVIDANYTHCFRLGEVVTTETKPDWDNKPIHKFYSQRLDKWQKLEEHEVTPVDEGPKFSIGDEVIYARKPNYFVAYDEGSVGEVVEIHEPGRYGSHKENYSYSIRVSSRTDIISQIVDEVSLDPLGKAEEPEVDTVTLLLDRVEALEARVETLEANIAEAHEPEEDEPMPEPQDIEMFYNNGFFKVIPGEIAVVVGNGKRAEDPDEDDIGVVHHWPEGVEIQVLALVPKGESPYKDYDVVQTQRVGEGVETFVQWVQSEHLKFHKFGD